MLNELAKEIHAANATWWHDPATGAPLTRNKGELLMLMVSELSEAMEGERKSLQDDHLPDRKMAEVELADTLIRLFDFAGGFNIDLDRGTVGIYLPDWVDNKGDALLQIVREITKASERPTSPRWEAWRLCRAIKLIYRYATAHGYDVDGAVREKREYNAVRADHRPEARLAANGKKW